MEGLVFTIFFIVNRYTSPMNLLRDVHVVYMGYMGAFGTSLEVTLLVL